MFSITHWLQTSYLSSLLLLKDLSRALTNTLLKEHVPWTQYQPLPLSVSFGRKGDVSDTSPWRGVNWAERPRVHIKSQKVIENLSFTNRTNVESFERFPSFKGRLSVELSVSVLSCLNNLDHCMKRQF